jgi:hypothetical protein
VDYTAPFDIPEYGAKRTAQLSQQRPLEAMMVTGVFDAKLFELLAQSFGALALWASAHAMRSRDDVADLTLRLRAPVKWTLTHPVRALGRTLRRRR